MTKHLEVLSASWYDKRNGNPYATVLVRVYDPATGNLASQVVESPGYGDVDSMLFYLRPHVEQAANLEDGTLRYGSAWRELAEFRQTYQGKYSTNSLHVWLLDRIDTSVPLVVTHAGNVSTTYLTDKAGA